MGSLHDSRIAMNGGARTPSKARQVDPRPSVVIFSRPNPDLARLTLETNAKASGQKLNGMAIGHAVNHTSYGPGLG